MSKPVHTRQSMDEALRRFAQGLDPRVETRDVGSPVTRVGFGTVCGDSTRVHLAGGEVVSKLLAKAFMPFERLYRKEVPPGAYLNASPRSPVTWELGAFAVPDQQALIVADYRFTAYRVGPGAGDPIPLEPERLSTSLGYVIGGRSMAQINAQLQLVPTPPQSQQQQVLNQNTLQVPWSPLPTPTGLLAGFGFGLTGPASQPPGSFPGYPENPTVFNQAAGVVQSPSTGSPVLPQTSLRVGARDMPFTLYFESSDSVQLLATVYKPLSTPLAYIEGQVSGFLINGNTLEALLQGVRPCT